MGSCRLYHVKFQFTYHPNHDKYTTALPLFDADSKARYLFVRHSLVISHPNDKSKPRGEVIFGTISGRLPRSECDVVVLLLDTKKTPNYFEGPKQLPGAIVSASAYQLSTVIHEDLYSVYQD